MANLYFMLDIVAEDVNFDDLMDDLASRTPYLIEVLENAIGSLKGDAEKSGFILRDSGSNDVGCAHWEDDEGSTYYCERANRDAADCGCARHIEDQLKGLTDEH